MTSPTQTLAEITPANFERYAITRSILEAILDLEKYRYYPQDLKCSNIMLGENHDLHIIDLGGGLTEGMYRLEAKDDILQGRIKPKDMLYTFGRTVWDLWDPEFTGVEKRPQNGRLPTLIEEMVMECSNDDVENQEILHMWERYESRLEQAAREVSWFY